MSTNCSSRTVIGMLFSRILYTYIQHTIWINQTFPFLRKSIYLAFKLVLIWILLTWLFFLDHWMNEFQKPIDLDHFLVSLLLFKWAFFSYSYVWTKISSWTFKSLYIDGEVLHNTLHTLHTLINNIFQCVMRDISKLDILNVSKTH